MRRLLQVTLLLGLLCCVVSGCGEPGYDYYGDPGYGYAPYSYGWWGRGHDLDFRDHHDWEDHHNNPGHHDTFSHFGGGHMGGFDGGRGGGYGGGFGGGHGGFGGGHGGGGGHR
jgi:hypothetical protein